MIAVSNRIRVHPDFFEAFEERFRNRAGLVETMPGFVRSHILRPLHPEQPYVVVTYWENHAAFDAWRQSEAFRQQHGGVRTLPPEALIGPPSIEVHEIIQEAERAG